METASSLSTRDVILAQLKENTGQHFLDSGGAYGRNWQYNATKEWDELAYSKDNGVRLNASVWQGKLWMDPTISLAAWMEANLEYCDVLQEEYDSFCKNEDADNDCSHFELVDRFVEERHTGSKYDEPQTINTYNGDSHLSQIVQYTRFKWEDPCGEEGDYVLLMVHGGCDARGGYTAPKAYKIGHDYLDDRADGYWCADGSWDSEGFPDNGGPHLFELVAQEFAYESTLEQDLANLAQTDKNTEATQALMRAEDARLAQAAFDEFCRDNPESVVVYKHLPYYVNGDGEPFQIHATACEMW